MLLEPLPFPRLRREDEVDDVAREQAQRAVVRVGRLLAIAARDHVPIRRERLAEGGGVPDAGVGPVQEEPALDRLLEAALRNIHRQPTLNPLGLEPPEIHGLAPSR